MCFIGWFIHSCPRETAEAVRDPWVGTRTSLKRGVNEIGYLAERNLFSANVPNAHRARAANILLAHWMKYFMLERSS